MAQTDGHVDTMTELAQWGPFGEKKEKINYVASFLFFFDIVNCLGILLFWNLVMLLLATKNT